VYGFPRPFDGVPPIMNAAGSKEGRQFAARNADFLFCIPVDPDQSRQEVIDIREQAKTYGRNTGVFTLCHVVCRPTIEEAQDYLHYYADEGADWAAVDNLMRLQGMHAQSFRGWNGWACDCLGQADATPGPDMNRRGLCKATLRE
jgi:FMNH2-dependent dimethyl sulfone monooxygenase